MAWKYERERKQFRDRFDSQFKNQMMYVKHGFTEFFKPSEPINDRIKIYINNSETPLPDSTRSLKLININSAMNGIFFWGTGKSRPDELQEWSAPRLGMIFTFCFFTFYFVFVLFRLVFIDVVCFYLFGMVWIENWKFVVTFVICIFCVLIFLDDGKIEVMCTRGVHDMITHKINLSHAHRLSQSNLIRIEVIKVPTAMQIDGEAWIIEEPLTMNVRLKDKIPTVIGYATPRGVESWLQASLDDPHIRKAKESFRERMKQKYHIIIDEEDNNNETDNDKNNSNETIENNNDRNNNQRNNLINAATGKSVDMSKAGAAYAVSDFASDDETDGNSSTNHNSQNNFSFASLLALGDFLAFGATQNTPTESDINTANDNNNNSNNTETNDSNEKETITNDSNKTKTNETNETNPTETTNNEEESDSNEKKKEPAAIDAFFRQIFSGLKIGAQTTNENSTDNTNDDNDSNKTSENDQDNSATLKNGSNDEIDLTQRSGNVSTRSHHSNHSNRSSNELNELSLQNINSNVTAPEEDDPEMDLDIEELFRTGPPVSSKDAKSNLMQSDLFLKKVEWFVFVCVRFVFCFCFVCNAMK